MSSAPDVVAATLRAAGSVFADDEARALRETFAGAALDAAVRRRVAGEPFEHVVGWADFAGVRVVVRPAVFVPRRRAEVLVEVGLEALQSKRSGAVAVDVGCGSGALAAALTRRHVGLRCHATDVDPDAVACAQENATTFGFAVHQGNWLDALPTTLAGTVDVVVAHLPYVPTPDLHLLPRDYACAERPLALDGGLDGLDPLRRVVAQLPTWLAPDGVLVTQVTAAQSGAAREVVDAVGLVVETRGVEGSVVLLVHP